MSAGEMSDGSPVTPQLDARLLADIRAWRARLAPTSLGGNRWSARLTIDELDMLLRVAAERDALKAALCSDWEADIPAEVRARAVQPEAMPHRHVNAPCSVEPILPAEITHATMCGASSGGSCFVPWCRCDCHLRRADVAPVR